LSNRPRTNAEQENLNKMTEKVKLKVEIFGVEYSSVTDAATTLKINNETLRYRCRSVGFPEYKIVGGAKCQR